MLLCACYSELPSPRERYNKLQELKKCAWTERKPYPYDRLLTYPHDTDDLPHRTGQMIDFIEVDKLEAINLDMFEKAEEVRMDNVQRNKCWEEEERETLSKLGLDASTHNQVLGLLMAVGNQTHVSEVFSPPRFTAQCHRFGLTPGLAMDLRTGWDFDVAEHRDKAWEHLVHDQPYLVIGSPECKAFSSMKLGSCLCLDGPWL